MGDREDTRQAARVALQSVGWPITTIGRVLGDPPPSRRERIAIAAMQWLLAAERPSGAEFGYRSFEDIAGDAVALADHLIEALDAEPGKEEE